MRRRWALGVLVLQAVLALTACEAPRTPQPARSERPATQETASSLPEAQFQVQAPVLEQADEHGQLLWRLKAQSLQGEAQGGEAHGVLRGVQGWLYREGKPVLEFTAPYARADSARREVEAWGGVRARSRVNNAELVAGRILWRAREDRIYARDSIRLRWDAFELRERAVIVDTALERAWGAR